MQVVSTDEYLKARQRLLEKEKELTRARDALNKDRQALPVVRVQKPYHFTYLDTSGHKAEKSLQDLFEGRPQLVVYYFMFDPASEDGCPACSFTTDALSTLEHLNSRGITFVCVSRAPMEKLEAYKRRMGYSFSWVSTYDSDFNHDHQATMVEDDESVTYAAGSAENALRQNLPWFTKGEQQGISCFIKGDSRAGIGEDGEIYQTYSTFARGVEPILATYGLLDMTKLGRQDGSGMSFRRHDEYSAEELRGIWS